MYHHQRVLTVWTLNLQTFLKVISCHTYKLGNLTFHIITSTSGRFMISGIDTQHVVLSGLFMSNVKILMCIWFVLRWNSRALFYICGVLFLYLLVSGDGIYVRMRWRSRKSFYVFKVWMLSVILKAGFSVKTAWKCLKYCLKVHGNRKHCVYTSHGAVKEANGSMNKGVFLGGVYKFCILADWICGLTP